MKLLEGKVAIVTGAAHPLGMGFAACRKLAEAGAKVVVTDLIRTDDELKNLQARVDEIMAAGGEAVAMAVDVTDRAQIDACVTATRDAFGSVDILFNNAGTPVGCGEFLQMTDRQWDLSYRVNLKGMVDFCQAVIPVMVDHGGGAIINNSSLSGLGAASEMAAYTATKFAVVGLSKALACEFAHQGIRVNAVCPGNIWTQMGAMEAEHHRREGETLEQVKARMLGEVPQGRWGSGDDVADTVVYLASDRASYINGVALPVAGGMAPGL